AGQPDLAAQLLAYLRERHMLLVLDNFEHLLDGADLLAAILAQAPHVTLLVTSRERLNLQAEWLFDVDGLAYPPESQPASAPTPQLADLADYSAVQLFVQRAAQVQPLVPLTAATLATTVRICQHVAGMPLAIELAAAALRSVPITAIEQQIRSNLDGLATSLRDIPARHRSMRAVFDHSWNLLSESERALFSAVAVFRGGWSVSAAEQVTGATLPALTALADKSLVRREDTTTARAAIARGVPNATTEARFSLSEPIREYALERLGASPDAEAVRRRHAHYFTALAEAAAAEWDTPRINAAIALQRREHDNMRAALQWACATGNSLLGFQLAWALWGFWRSYGYGSEGRTWLEQLLGLGDQSTDPTALTARQRGLHAAAWLASDQHDFVTATRLFEESMTLRRALGESEGETALLINAARQARAIGKYQQATALLEDALSHHRSTNARTSLSSAGLRLSLQELGQVLRELALVLRERGDFARAIALLDEGLALCRASDDRVSVALTLLGRSDVARDQGNSAAVREHCEPSLAVFRESSMQWAIGFALNNLALAAYGDGDLTQAFALIDESVSLFRDLQANASRAEALITLGKIVLAQGDGVAAYAALTEALQLALTLGPRLMVVTALEGLASVAAEQRHAGLVVQLLAVAAAARVQMGALVRPADQGAVNAALAIAQSILGDNAFAATWAAAAELPLEQILGALPGASAFQAPSSNRDLSIKRNAS
ncbi:MAG: tetratricopeptide repeat protein, partial [Chloroflexales bacterium]|nr:tetratricopeptide repeat protein [Chloroflexales bacterium]